MKQNNETTHCLNSFLYNLCLCLYLQEFRRNAINKSSNLATCNLKQMTVHYDLTTHTTVTRNLATCNLATHNPQSCNLQPALYSLLRVTLDNGSLSQPFWQRGPLFQGQCLIETIRQLNFAYCIIPGGAYHHPCDKRHCYATFNFITPNPQIFHNLQPAKFTTRNPQFHNLQNSQPATPNFTTQQPAKFIICSLQNS